MKRVMAAGVFDFFHPGHRFFLQSAREQGDFLTVVVARDENVQKIKGFMPHFTENDRLSQVQKSGLADEAILGKRGGDFLRIVADLNPDVIVLGYDQKLPAALPAVFPELEIVRLPAKNPAKWKSSSFRKKLERKR